MMEMGKFTEQKKFGLVFEEHLLEFLFWSLWKWL